MKVLVVCSFNRRRIAPFITEQVESLRKRGVVIDYYLIIGKGIFGYIRNYRSLKKKISNFNPDLIHAHYGFSGLLAGFQRKIPIITTYHGSDINLWWIRPFSAISAFLSRHNIFISEGLVKKTLYKGKEYSIIPNGVDLNLFLPLNKNIARKSLDISEKEKIVLFSGSFNNKVKNHSLAQKSIDLLKKVKLLELKRYSREEVNLLLNASDVILMTSFHEGSPQIIKEAMSCNRPIVSTDVGDVNKLIGQVNGCYIADSNPSVIASKIIDALKMEKTEDGRRRIIEFGLDLDSVSSKIFNLYNVVIKRP
jgi:glycosyltransferase involved in cell wall biosynthesis